MEVAVAVAVAMAVAVAIVGWVQREGFLKWKPIPNARNPSCDDCVMTDPAKNSIVA